MLTNEQIYEKALNATNAAGVKWLDENKEAKYTIINEITGERGEGLKDLCGNAWVVFRDKRIGFYRWLKKKDSLISRYWRVPHKYHRKQWMGMHEACAHAAADVLKKHGIKCWVKSYVD